MFPWQPTGFPPIDKLGVQAESLYDWALAHGSPAPQATDKLAEWARKSMENTLSAEVAGLLLPEIVKVAWTQGSISLEEHADSVGQEISDDMENFPIPEMAVLAAEYLSIAADAVHTHQVKVAHAAIAQANGAIGLALRTRDYRVRKQGQSIGGKSREIGSKPQVLEEAGALLADGHNKDSVADLLHRKYGLKYGTVRDWLKGR